MAVATAGKRKSKFPVLAAGLVFFAAASVGHATPIALDRLVDWSVQYVIDNSQTVLGQSQAVNPRNNRGLALSPDGRYLYAGYNRNNGVGEEVRKIDLTVPDYTAATVARLPGLQGKSIAVDDQGRVYIAEASSIRIYDANLGSLLYTVATTNSEGVEVVREAGTLALYASDRTTKTVSRWALTESGSGIAAATAAGLDGDGVITIAGAVSLRGLGVDASGRIWIADAGAGMVFRVNGDGTGQVSAPLAGAIDLGLDSGPGYNQVFVSQAGQRRITVFQDDLTVLGTLTAPWAALQLDPDGQSAGGALSGIVVLPGVGLYVTNESGQTADEKSIYGNIDGASGWLGATFYTDLFADDNDPILGLRMPEPGAPQLLLTGLLLLASSRLRRKRA